MSRRRPKPAPKRRRYHHGDLARALIDAAAAMLAEDGARAVSLRAVARRAGVSQTAPYRHFSDKGALLADGTPAQVTQVLGGETLEAGFIARTG